MWIQISNLSLFEHNFVWANFRWGKTICNLRMTKITQAKVTPDTVLFWNWVLKYKRYIRKRLKTTLAIFYLMLQWMLVQKHLKSNIWLHDKRSKTCLNRRRMVLKNLARIGNIRFGGNFCKFILGFDAVGINHLFLQDFNSFFLLDRADGANFHFHILFGKQ